MAIARRTFWRPNRFTHWRRPYRPRRHLRHQERIINPAADPSLGAVSYWGVESIGAAVERLVQLGATVISPIVDVGDGIRVATIAEPSTTRIGPGR